jgi:hypothetical protein
VRRLILAMLLVLPLGASAFCQTVDTFDIAETYIVPGTSSVISVVLTNHMFEAGGFSVFLNLSDSLTARFVSVQRGSATTNFEYFMAFCDTGTIRITAIANMPSGSITPPLTFGSHEIAKITLSVEPNSPVGMSTQISFDDSRTSITDTSGYWVITPITNDGVVIFGSGQGIEPDAGLIDGFALNQNYPNPFNGETKISYQIQQSGSAKLEIFDIQGRRIAQYEQGNTEPGIYNYIWTGKDQDGNGLPSGIYFYRLSMLGKSITKKMSFLK